MNGEDQATSNLNILGEQLLPPPRALKERLPASEAARTTVRAAREGIKNILRQKDRRLLVVVGPCSIHDTEAALEYGTRLRALQDQVGDEFLLVMRAYFEKPRTSVGWKGFINDPHLDDTFRIEEGLQLARGLLRDLAEIGVPIGTEALDPVTPQYLDDLVSWTAIGARTTESQTHREMASGLSTPVGFKNGTDGNIQVAINALRSVSMPHHFLGISQDGRCAVMQTRGNRYAHVVLRGGADRPNYDSVSVALCEKTLAAAGIEPRIMIDCSHGNSMKDYKLQPLVFENCINQLAEGNQSIVGMMLESNLNAGTQPLPRDGSKLAYGVSITDGCIDWETTESIIRAAADQLRAVLPARTLL